ncbi:peptidoglycan-binding protein [Cronbergia sp. UHCC 0137]|uniref:peptidoglycan-binding protein n=1 Tax=Cronbergia sp. UHCC 0137 TaxID=3110239 RepID=UPI002B1FD18E|nr:peptidoglycan-binding protein [Cronbergia sp. UHCC 0137]MEA5618651.1 peptidoglycan-binding protein [Cronbergia sp. UHCC 0137]
MKGKLKTNILCSLTFLLISSSGMIAIAPPKAIAQVTTSYINRPILKLGSQGERVSELQASLKLLGFYTGAVDGIYQETTANAVSRFKQAAGLSPDGIVDTITWQKLFPSTSSETSTIPQPNPINSFTVPTLPTTTNPKPATSKPPTPKPTISQKNRTVQPTPPNKRLPHIQYTPEGWPILRLKMRGADVLKLQQQLHRLGFLKGALDGDFGVTTEAAVKAAQIRYKLEADGVVGRATWEVLSRP